MTIDEARELFAYGTWANAQVLDAVEALAEEEREATIASSFSSVLGTLGHIVSAEWVWLQRWRGRSPQGPPDWARGSSLSAVRRALAEVEKEREEYLAVLSDGDLARVVEYRTLAGESQGNRLEDLIRHVVNHSTYHRGQVATQLRQLGRTPPSTDLILYLRFARPTQSGRT